MKKIKALGLIGFLVMFMVSILVAAALVTTVADESIKATENADVQAVPGGVALVNLWPLLFIIVPVVVLAKKIR